MHLQPKIEPAPIKKNRYVVFFSMLCASIPAVAVAAPFPAMDFTGIIYFIYAFFASLLLCAFYVKNKYSKIVLLIPALLVAYTHSRNIFVWEVEEARIIKIAISFVYAAVILLLFVHTKRPSTKGPYLIIPALALCYFTALLLNPAYFNVVALSPEDNDPFNGKGVIVSKIIESPYLYGDARNQKRVDNTLVLDDGRRIPGIFHGVTVGDTVLIKKTKFSNYAYHQYGLVKRNFKPVSPRFKFPPQNLILKKVKLNYSTGVEGWGHDL